MADLKSGRCHCGAVEFEVTLENGLENIRRCNCSLCRRKGALMASVPISKLRVTKGADTLTLYQWNTKTAKHYFCSNCGVKSFYVPRSNPDGFSVNVRCLDPGTIDSMEIDTFDGRHWEEHAHTLRHLTE